MEILESWNSKYFMNTSSSEQTNLGKSLWPLGLTRWVHLRTRHPHLLFVLSMHHENQLISYIRSDLRSPEHYQAPKRDLGVDYNFFSLSPEINEIYEGFYWVWLLFIGLIQVYLLPLYYKKFFQIRNPSFDIYIQVPEDFQKLEICQQSCSFN